MADKSQNEIEKKVADVITPLDLMAYFLLKDWIPTGFPTIDPVQQVETAYQYAKIMLQVRKNFEGQ